jgi:hypothetical protein
MPLAGCSGLPAHLELQKYPLDRGGVGPSMAQNSNYSRETDFDRLPVSAFFSRRKILKRSDCHLKFETWSSSLSGLLPQPQSGLSPLLLFLPLRCPKCLQLLQRAYCNSIGDGGLRLEWRERREAYQIEKEKQEARVQLSIDRLGFGYSQQN